MYWPMLLLFSWPFWIVVFAFLVAIIWCLEDESPISATFFVLLGATVFVLLSDFPTTDVLKWAGDHVFTILEYIGAYILAGGAWAFVKWYFFSLNVADKIEGMIDIYKRGWTSNPTLQTDYPAFKDYLISKTPNPMENKSRIYLWMAYWPCSALWTLINDPLKRIYRFFLDVMSSTMAKVSKAVFNRRFGHLS